MSAAEPTPIRVLAISRNFPNPLRPYEGPWAYTQFAALAECGAQVKVFSPRLVNLKTLLAPADAWYSLARPRHWHWKELEVYGPRGMFLVAGRKFRHTYARQTLDKVVAAVDEIYQQWPFQAIYTQSIYPDGWVARQLAQRYGIVASSCIIGEAEVTQVIKDPAIREIVVETLRELEVVVAESRRVAELGMELIGNARPIHPLHRGSFPEDIKIDPEVNRRWREKFAFPPEAVVIMFVGHLYTAKGIFDLLDAFGQFRGEFPAARLVMVGTGTEEKTLRNKINQANLGELVRLTGVVPSWEVPSLMSLADIICSPSHTEGLGLVNVEAGFCEKPVVGARTGGIPEAICEGTTGLLFEPRNVADLAAKLKILLADAGLRQQMGQAAKKYVSEKHNAHINTRMLYDLLLGAIGKKAK